MNIIDHGVWLPYTPDKDKWPEGAPPNAMFARRSDGIDWFVYRRTNFQTDSVKFMAIWREAQGGYIVGTAARDVTMLFPAHHIVCEITDYVGNDPQDELRGKLYDSEAHTFSEQQQRVAARSAEPTMQELIARIEALETKVNHLTG